MDKIKFNVSSKTARLIGRENISDANGAVIELVKNAYDADADTVYIEFDIIFENVPNEISIAKYKKYFKDEEFKFLLSVYNQNDDILIKKENLSLVQEDSLRDLLFSKNKVIILDNGSGMSEEIVRTVWMNIGTNDKEINTHSKKGRIKTGAKGIGRFALEKLSQRTIVYTKQQGKPIVYWSLDWKQFENLKLLDEIKADIDIIDEEFDEIISKYVDLALFAEKNDGIKNGTLIILCGTRENWNERIFNRINNNLESINPFGSVDKFEVFINNKVKTEFDFLPRSNSLSEEDYDYLITANYDGENSVLISLTRNEINLNAKNQSIPIRSKTYEFNIKEFWERDAFARYPYKKENYNETINNTYQATELVKNATLEEIKKIGKFNLELYFLKSGKSEYSFIKDIKVNKRKNLLKSFSGVKIYRDNFKVRPYGEEGPMYDWLQLGSRVQSSPAGITHPNGSWRVNTYQLIGNVHISKFANPNLEDMANREGLALNDTYYLFVELIQNIISKFEYDRQYVYREYGLWYKSNVESINKAQAIADKVIEEKEKINNEKNESTIEYTEEEYKDAIYQFANEKKYSIDTQRILMNFSSVGVTANTFAHEMKGISTNLSTRNKQLRMCIDAILKNEGYKGPDFMNPYSVIESGEKYDTLLSKWLKLIIDSVNPKNAIREKINLLDFFNQIFGDWSGLLEKKSIHTKIMSNEECIIECEKIDLYLIFNNLILNSAFFLEKEVIGKKREIKITFEEDNEYVNIYFENNGPKLDKKYSNTPDIIFNAGETTKEDGTGLGLWICKETVQRNHGEIHVVPYDSGFKIKINLPKV